MKNLTLKNIAAAVSGTYHGPAENLEKEIDNACFDSRQLRPGGLFFATKGEKTNGHKFLPAVYEAGALCAVTERELTKEDIPASMQLSDVSYIQVTDCFAAIRRLAAFYRQQLDIKVVSVTGSVGKTSTKELIAAVLSASFKVLKTEKNHNNALGLPLTIFQLREEHEVAVLEMGISDFGEMALLASVARPDIGVITNIGQCHLENLGDRDGVFRAKTEFFGYLQKGGRVVLNGGDDKLAAVKDVQGLPPVFFNDDKTCYAKEIQSRGLKGTDCIIDTPEFSVHAKIPVPGRHQILNAMAAVRVGQLLGMDKEKIEEGIARTPVIDGRTNVIETGKLTIVDDCYNANPVSMKAALALLAEADTRKVAILGDMFELGSEEKKLHYGVGTAMQKDGIAPDLLICIGDLAKEIFDGAGDVCKKVHFPDKESFLQQAQDLLKEGDSVLLKASHGMAFEELVKALQEMYA